MPYTFTQICMSTLNVDTMFRDSMTNSDNLEDKSLCFSAIITGAS